MRTDLDEGQQQRVGPFAVEAVDVRAALPVAGQPQPDSDAHDAHLPLSGVSSHLLAPGLGDVGGWLSLVGGAALPREVVAFGPLHSFCVPHLECEANRYIWDGVYPKIKEGKYYGIGNRLKIGIRDIISGQVDISASFEEKM